MFGFGKKKSAKNKKVALTASTDSKLSAQIHVMPARFYIAPKKKHSGPILVGILGLAIIVGLSVAAYYLNENLINNKVANANVVVENVNNNTNENVNQNSNINIATTTEIVVTPTTTPTTTENTNVNVNTNTNTNRGGEEVSNQPLPSSPDNDNDSLTLPEENLYNTDPNKSDTDGDGYADGAELLSGYDPTAIGRSLADSGLVKLYTHPLYTIYYPTHWYISEQDNQKNEVLFRSATGEFVEVLVVAIPNKMSLTDWYKTQASPQDVASATVVKINELSGLRTANLQTYYLAKPNDTSKVFVINYNTGNFGQTNFATTFAVMIKNFHLK
ncbi:MAG: hypothetical protein PHW95_04870 [Patescibacteria group bacterium]|nr:hypothetical protein [Patescibacteria group bacterium]